MFDFYKNAVVRNLCADYKKEWKSDMAFQKKLYEFSMLTGSIPYLATSIYRGWGIPIDYVAKNFTEYINGAYVIENSNGVEGATAVSYYDYEFIGEELPYSLIAIYRCRGYCSCVDYGAPRLHISNHSDIDLSIGLDSRVWINLYDESSVNLGDVCKGTTVYVVKYSDECKVNYKDCGGRVVIRRRDVDVDAFYEVKNINEK